TEELSGRQVDLRLVETEHVLGGQGCSQFLGEGEPVDDLHVQAVDEPLGASLPLVLGVVEGDVDVAEERDYFGADTALLDVDGDTLADLVMSSPGESISAMQNSGAVFVERDVTTGDAAASMFNQNSASIAGVAEADDRFGASLGS
ncbi:MAG: FG-GAP repeat protein, partial [Actinomycetota bacterium]